MDWDRELEMYYSDPQEEEQMPVFYCEKCHEEIYAGDSYWKIDGYILCEDCAKKEYQHEA